MPISRRALLTAPFGLKSITPAAFGLRGDGTDETAKLKALADYLGIHGGVCVFPPGKTYLQSEGVVFGGGGYTIDGNGSTIRMVDGTVADHRHFGLKFKCTHCNIRNLIVDGNRQRRHPAENPCHSFYLEGARQGVFENCHAVNAVCDGWILWESTPGDPASWCSNVVLHACSADNSYRNGLSIINGFDVLVAGGRYDHSNGTAPQAGIDLEADPGGPKPSMRHVRLVGLTATGNRGYGVQVSGVGAPAELSLESVLVDGSGGGATAMGFYLGAPVRLSSIRTRNLPISRAVHDHRRLWGL